MATRSARSRNFSKYFSMGKNFSILSEWGGWVMESMENSIFFWNCPLLVAKNKKYHLMAIKMDGIDNGERIKAKNQNPIIWSCFQKVSKVSDAHLPYGNYLWRAVIRKKISPHETTY